MVVFLGEPTVMVVGHVAPEAAVGGTIALVEEGIKLLLMLVSVS
jgi:dihydroxyacid dehydratase/phosphogluconate dehydratase